MAILEPIGLPVAIPLPFCAVHVSNKWKKIDLKIAWVNQMSALSG